MARQLPDRSRAEIQDWIRTGAVGVNGAVWRRAAQRLRGGEQVAVAAALARRPRPPAPPETAAAPPLAIVFEDADLVVVNKPAGLVVHPGAGGTGATLAGALVAHFGLAGLSAGGGPDRPGIVHRLDRDASGLLVVAKNDWAHRKLAAQFQARQVTKRYLALVHGAVAEQAGRVDLPIARDLRRRARMTTRRSAGREAHTRYRVRERWPLGPAAGRRVPGPAYTFLEIEILTGRTHQIRAHMAALGHPLLGDRLYGAPAQQPGPGPLEGERLGRVFLHAALLGLAHPRTGQAMTWEAALPDELEAWLRRLRGGPGGAGAAG